MAVLKSPAVRKFVGLEGGDALTDPVVDPAAGICGVGELIDLNGEGSRAFEAGSAAG